MNTKKPKPPDSRIIFVGLGIELIGLILGSIWIGQKWDEEYKMRGVITVGLLLAVLVGWFVRLLYLLRRFEKTQGNTNE